MCWGARYPAQNFAGPPHYKNARAGAGSLGLGPGRILASPRYLGPYFRSPNRLQKAAERNDFQSVVRPLEAR